MLPVKFIEEIQHAFDTFPLLPEHDRHIALFLSTAGMVATKKRKCRDRVRNIRSFADKKKTSLQLTYAWSV